MDDAVLQLAEKALKAKRSQAAKRGLRKKQETTLMDDYEKAYRELARAEANLWLLGKEDVPAAENCFSLLLGRLRRI